MPVPAGSRRHHRIAGKPGRQRSQGATGVKQRKQQRKRLAKRRAGTSS